MLRCIHPSQRLPHTSWSNFSLLSISLLSSVFGVIIAAFGSFCSSFCSALGFFLGLPFFLEPPAVEPRAFALYAARNGGPAITLIWMGQSWQGQYEESVGIEVGLRMRLDWYKFRSPKLEHYIRT